MRAHCKAHPPTDSKHKKLSEATKRILAKECKIVADFTPVHLEPKKRIARFPPNPGKYVCVFVSGNCFSVAWTS